MGLTYMGNNFGILCPLVLRHFAYLDTLLERLYSSKLWNIFMGIAYMGQNFGILCPLTLRHFAIQSFLGTTVSLFYSLSCATKVRDIIRLLPRSGILLDSFLAELFVGVFMLLRNNQCSPK